MASKLWTGKQWNITINGQGVEVKPLTLENSLRLILLLAPHVAKIQRHWGRLKGNPKLLEAILKDLANELAFAPGDIVTAFALCLDVEPEWVARNASAADLINALPVLDEVNGGFVDLWRACELLGITAPQ